MSSLPKKRAKTLTRRLLRRALRRLSPRARVLILITFGFLLGIVVQHVLHTYLSPLFQRHLPQPPSIQTHHIIDNDHYHQPNTQSFTFFFATGRCGTQHLSRVLLSTPRTASYVTHEEEHSTQRTKQVMYHSYRPLAASADDASFNRSALEYVSKTKLPFYRQLLHTHAAKRLVYTGHVPLAFGLGPSLVTALPPGTLRIVRLRRDRIATAISLMALGPSHQDPWGDTLDDPPVVDIGTSMTAFSLPPPTVNSRWFPRPTDAFVRLHVSPVAWYSLNRFQRWLWYVDDVECRWQAILHTFGHRFSWMEESLENLSVMDGGRAWKRLAEFIGVDIDWNQVTTRDNSIQHKQRLKTDASESQLREWDVQYRKLVGHCSISSTLSYDWQHITVRTQS